MAGSNKSPAERFVRSLLSLLLVLQLKKSIKFLDVFFFLAEQRGA